MLHWFVSGFPFVTRFSCIVDLCNYTILFLFLKLDEGKLDVSIGSLGSYAYMEGICFFIHAYIHM
jgi:hypothetical protein